MPAKAKDAPAVTTESVAAAEKPARRPRTFTMCEGVREELERTGKATDPYTGELLEK